MKCIHCARDADEGMSTTFTDGTTQFVCINKSCVDTEQVQEDARACLRHLKRCKALEGTYIDKASILVLQAAQIIVKRHML
jgi:ADP-ribosylglycohydrolase